MSESAQKFCNGTKIKTNFDKFIESVEFYYDEEDVTLCFDDKEFKELENKLNVLKE